MKTIINKRMTVLVLCIIIVLQTLVMLYWCTQKQAYFCDEMYTYGLSNNHNKWHLYLEDDYLNTWHDSSLWHDYLTVQEGHRFDYETVVRNQSEDVHPPLYYFVIHTVCSFFPEQFSKWFGLLPNVLFFIMTQIVLYLIMKTLTNNSAFAIVPVIIYGFSVGAINTVLLIRMYMMQSFWILLQLYIHICLCNSLECGTKLKKNLLLIATYATTLAGFMTQYYFVIFAFFLSAGYFIYQLLQKRWIHLFKYAVAMFGALATGYIVFPSCYEHILGNGERGQEAFANMSSANFSAKLKPFWDYLNTELFMGSLNVILVILLLIIVIMTIRHYIHISISKDHSNYKFSFVLRKASNDLAITISQNQILVSIISIACIGYFCIVAKISSLEADRYIFPIYPVVVMCAYFTFTKVMSLCVKNSTFVNAAIVCIALTGNVVQYSNKSVEYLYSDLGSYYQMIADDYGGNTAALYVTFGDWSYVYNVPLFEKYEKTYCVAKEDIPDAVDIVNEYAIDHNYIFLHISYTYKDQWEDIARQIVDLTDFNTYSFMYENSDGIFLLTKYESEDAALKNGYYSILSADGNYVLSTENHSIDNSANVICYQIAKPYPEVFVYFEDGHYLISFANSSKQLDVAYGLAVPKTNVQQYERNGYDAQFWYLKDAGDGYYYIYYKDDLVLTMDPDTLNVMIDKFSGSENQKWSFVKAE